MSVTVWRENAFTDEGRKGFDLSAGKGAVDNISQTRLLSEQLLAVGENG